MKRCGVCRQMYRGRGTRVVALSPEPRRVLACQACVKRTAPVLVAGTATPCKCGAVALLCHPCARLDTQASRATQLAGALKLINDRRKAYARAPQSGEQSDHAAGILEGLRMAADLIKTGDWLEAEPEPLELDLSAGKVSK